MRTPVYIRCGELFAVAADAYQNIYGALEYVYTYTFIYAYAYYIYI